MERLREPLKLGFRTRGRACSSRPERPEFCWDDRDTCCAHAYSQTSFNHSKSTCMERRAIQNLGNIPPKSPVAFLSSLAKNPPPSRFSRFCPTLISISHLLWCLRSQHAVVIDETLFDVNNVYNLYILGGEAVSIDRRRGR